MAWNDGRGGSPFVPAEIVVQFRAGVAPDTALGIDRAHGAASIRVGARSGLHRLHLAPGSDVDAAVAFLRMNPAVLSAVPNPIVRVFSGPNDPYYRLQWHLDNTTWGGIHWQPVWERTDRPSGDGVAVAVIDTGVAWDNPNATDLAGQRFSILPGSDVKNDDDNPSDDHGHGTHVAGTIAQATDNVRGVAGVASGATIVPIKVLDAGGSGDLVDVLEGIYLAVSATAPCAFDPAAAPAARVINMSIGFTAGTTLDQLPGLADALECAQQRDVVVVAAAGNDGVADVSYPAKYPTVIAVGATTIDERFAWYSNRGSEVDLLAPGGENCSGLNNLMCILNGTPSADINGDGYVDAVLQQTFAIGSDPQNAQNWAYYFLAGTSMASPHVAGVAALIRGMNPALDVANVRLTLTETADPLGTDGRRLVNAAAAAQRAADTLGANEPPVASAGADQTGNEGQAIPFDGSASTDPDGAIVSYEWTFGDDTGGTGASVSHAFADDGQYSVTLTVTDNRGARATDTTVVTVSNVAPTAVAGGPYGGAVGQPIAFSGGASDPGTADTLSYSWSFGDGTEASGAQVSHTYATPGTYTTVLTVTDDDLGVGQSSATVTVNAASSPPAYLTINMSRQLSKRGWRATASISVRETDASGPPLKSATVFGHWSGAYSGNVSATTNKNGVVEFRTDNIAGAGTVTFTVDQLVKGGQTYVLAGETSGSISQ